MKRHAVNALFVVSLTLFVATLAMRFCVYVMHHRPLHVIKTSGGWEWLVKAEPYEMTIARVRRAGPATSPYLGNPRKLWWWRFGGFRYVSSASNAMPVPNALVEIRTLSCRYEAILLITGLTAIASHFIRRRLRGSWRRENGLCSGCGYEIRATPDRCPECGAVPSGSYVGKE